METNNRLFIKSVLMLSALFFLSCSSSDKNEIEHSKNIVVLVKYKTQPSKEKETLSALSDLIESVKKEPHFVKIKLHIDSKDKSNILLYEEWNDAAYYNSKHLQTSHL
ncbi:antibiotic biosynthesis monooxygenase [Chryseobacterium sp. POL2]|uniref:putative quinol monooxygenase n=1 Tax=Chryseobacterium sp. POL2 TaxID=2713414 RepID=UPI0013E12ED3|nr:antibiotic biosynthesis monooxygenase family protein [Chryseobacterium sp. POL2]QIG88462.1 antibiotic biosynthesis monooxygenase [Chryseobacterium sp. POL2]